MAIQRMLCRIGCIIISLFFFHYSFSQEDSIQLKMDELGIGDMKDNIIMAEDQMMSSGGRFLQNKDELPSTAFIITKEDILDNGFITLVDVMRSLPGIRVSQPGSGSEGETFMLRGLMGNSHMKILLNDNPIKPSVVRGMPIGAQLPIRQAERIEIIFGPSAVLYGADASMGVINIITTDSERPVYVQADMSAGSNGFTSIDVMFGGKLGRNKHILKYNMYASNTLMNNRSIFYDEEEVYNPLNYINIQQGAALDTNFVNNPNYSGTASNPDLSKTPHASRLFGVHLKYKDLSISSQLMSRRDHSAIGLNPLAVAYDDPGNYYGEAILTSNLTFKKNFKKWGLKTNLNYLRYETDVNSSHKFIEDKLFRAVKRLVRNIDSSTVRDSIQAVIQGALYANDRFSYALSNDTKIEQLFYFAPTDYMNITAGANVNLVVGLSQAYYLESAFDNSGIVVNNPLPDVLLPSEYYAFADWSTFVQTQLNSKRIKGTIGYQYYQHPYFGDAHSPEIALLYQVKDGLNIRMNYGSAFRVPPQYYRANTYYLQLGNENFISNQDQDLFPEITRGIELGLRHYKDGAFKTDVSLYYNQTRNFISYNFDDEVEFEDGTLEYIQGYFNDNGSRATLYGIQAHMESFSRINQTKLKLELGLNYNWGYEILPENQGRLDIVRGQPNFIGQFNVSLRFWKESIYLLFRNIYVSSFVKSNVFSQTNYESNPDRFTNDGFYTLDILSRYRISKNFQGYINIRNVFNKRYAGIDATGTIDDLVYNPQSLRTFNFGLSYRIE